MQILINQVPHDLPVDSTVQTALDHVEFKPPYAVALNRQFVARGSYATQALQDGDRLDVVHPVMGG